MAEPIKCPFCNTTHPLPEGPHDLGDKYPCQCGARWCLTLEPSDELMEADKDDWRIVSDVDTFEDIEGPSVPEPVHTVFRRPRPTESIACPFCGAVHAFPAEQLESGWLNPEEHTCSCRAVWSVVDTMRTREMDGHEYRYLGTDGQPMTPPSSFGWNRCVHAVFRRKIPDPSTSL